ncbi:DUF2231 domain-containing protein [Roseomonas genomospecies 6]|uniref:DUF2231 domain-containing protein n=1 Tax=Roseomonas genomospecies 6 TaxID=214106 RepID=A0A9W7NM47_9PROT|nr:DUF2231 domain-containing protein [Roseomonas genomospecies 6]KAA0682817.1 hypothetical protein DS843_05235 [Roseomonas genomospecies 6]
MVAIVDHSRPARAIHPLHAVLLAATLPLFLGGLLCDFAYSRSYEIQWSNFASWLIAGGMVFAGLSLLWAFIDLFRAGRRRGRAVAYFVLLLITFALGLVNAFVHARDAWGTMPEGLILSAAVAVTAALATWFGFSSLRMDPRTGEMR